jgi:hypothetical protein
MKHGYTCQCGWRIERKNLTRREYAAKKALHAGLECVLLANEIRQSRGLKPLDTFAERPYALNAA